MKEQREQRRADRKIRCKKVNSRVAFNRKLRNTNARTAIMHEVLLLRTLKWTMLNHC
jgi:hypothetical protein